MTKPPELGRIFDEIPITTLIRTLNAVWNRRRQLVQASATRPGVGNSSHSEFRFNFRTPLIPDANFVSENGVSDQCDLGFGTLVPFICEISIRTIESGNCFNSWLLWLKRLINGPIGRFGLELRRNSKPCSQLVSTLAEPAFSRNVRVIVPTTHRTI